MTIYHIQHLTYEIWMSSWHLTVSTLLILISCQHLTFDIYDLIAVSTFDFFNFVILNVELAQHLTFAFRMSLRHTTFEIHKKNMLCFKTTFDVRLLNVFKTFNITFEFCNFFFILNVLTAHYSTFAISCRYNKKETFKIHRNECSTLAIWKLARHSIFLSL